MAELTLELLKERNAALTLQLRRAVDEERRRIASILHDGLAQDLALVHMRLQAMQAEDMAGLRGQQAVQNRPKPQRMQEVFDLLEEAIGRAAALTSDLWPPVLQCEGLGGGLAWLCQRAWAQRGVPVEYFETGDCNPCPRDLASVLFIAARELLANACKHGRPCRILVRLNAREDELELEVSDDGIGFAQARQNPGRKGEGWGLANLRSTIADLGGEVEAADACGAGARVTVRVPRRMNRARRELASVGDGP